MPYELKLVGQDSKTGADREDVVIWRKPTRSAYEGFSAKVSKVKGGDEIAARRQVENFVRTLVDKPDGEGLDELVEEYPNVFFEVLKDAACVAEGREPERSTKSR